MYVTGVLLLCAAQIKEQNPYKGQVHSARPRLLHPDAPPVTKPGSVPPPAFICVCMHAHTSEGLGAQAPRPTSTLRAARAGAPGVDVERKRGEALDAGFQGRPVGLEQVPTAEGLLLLSVCAPLAPARRLCRETPGRLAHVYQSVHAPARVSARSVGLGPYIYDITGKQGLLA